MLCLHSAFEVSRFTEIYTEPYQQSVRATELSARTVPIILLIYILLVHFKSERPWLPISVFLLLKLPLPSPKSYARETILILSEPYNLTHPTYMIYLVLPLTMYDQAAFMRLMDLKGLYSGVSRA